MTKKSDAPAIRFKGFSDAWEQRKLGELCNITTGKLDANAMVSDSQYDFYTSGIDVFKIDVAAFEGPAITIAGNGASVGYMHLADGKFNAYQRTYVLTDFLADRQFLNVAIGNELPNKIQEEVRGSGIPYIVLNMLTDLAIPFPSHEEQYAIGVYFQQLDNLITLHQRKCANLCSPSQVVFSLLFATSTFSWEQRKVQDVADRFDNLRIPVAANLRVHGTTPYYGANGIQDYVEGFTHDGEFVLVAEDGANDLKNYPVKCVNGRIWVNNHAHILQGKAGIADNSFLAFAISQSDIESLLVGGGRAKLNAETLMSIEFRLPCLQEQYRIGEYLTQLDHLITLHQRECISFTGRADRLILTANKKRTTSSWEQRKFGEVFDCTVPNNTLSRAELSYDEGTVLNVHYGDVLIKYGSVLDVQKDDIPRIPHRCIEDFNGALLQDGDVIIADTAEDETTGKACEIGNLQGSTIVSGLHTIVCRPRNRMALGYLGYYLNSNAYHHQLLPLMQGIKVLSLSRSNIQKTSVSYPSAMKEQQLIASYFSQLDHLITLHQRKPFLMKWRNSDANRNQTNRLVL